MYKIFLLLFGSVAETLPDALPDAKPPVMQAAVVHSGQPITVPKGVPLILGVPYDHRLPGPTNWFKCPWCNSSTDLMFLGEHLRGHGVSTEDLDRVGNRRWSMFHDNIHNKDWKPPTMSRPTRASGCENGTCRRPLFRGLLRGGMKG